jgi:hypothetical protein
MVKYLRISSYIRKPFLIHLKRSKNSMDKLIQRNINSSLKVNNLVVFQRYFYTTDYKAYSEDDNTAN